MKKPLPTLSGIFKHLNSIPLLWMIYLSVIQSGSVHAQAITGSSGYFNIPCAELSADKALNFGYNHLTRNYYDLYNHKYDLEAVYVNLGFLPFAEVGGRITRPIGFQTTQKTTWDRMAVAKIKPLSESTYFPAIVLGFQGFFTTSDDGGANFFNSTYIVASKNININYLVNSIGLTAGYGTDVIKAATYQFIGFFWGVRVVPQYLHQLELFFEYDADKYNAGARLTILKHLVLIAGFEGLDSFSGGIALKFNLP